MRTLLASALILAGCLAVQADQVVFRDGSVEEGTILSEHNDVYTFETRRQGIRPVAKERVRFVVYADPGVGAERLHLDTWRGRCPEPGPAPVEILPAEAYVDRVLEAVQNAQRYIYVMTYGLSGSQSGKIADLYQALGERAAAGVKVYVIAPAGSRAAAGVRIASRKAAESLAESGIQVRFLQQSKVQHKKLIIVDTREVFLGSSNLTAAGVTRNIELNMATQAPAFVAEAVKDFRSMLRRAKRPEQLTDSL